MMNSKVLVMAVTSVVGFSILGGCSTQSKQDYGAAGDNLGTAAKEVGAGLTKDAKSATAETEAATMTAKIKSALISAKDVDATGIDVDTNGQTVTLKGKVPNAQQSTKAEQIAKDQAGSSYSVTNELKVAG